MGRLRSGLRAGNVMGALALVVALGGGAYAAASSGSQTITVCVHKIGGALYRASKCAQHDSTLSWNMVGPRGPRGLPGKNGRPGINGTTIVARARSTAPLIVSNTVQTDTLTGNTWTQAANELDTIVPDLATIQEPANSDCGASPFGQLTATLKLDGSSVGTLLVTDFGSTQAIITVPFSLASTSVFEPGTATPHTLTFEVSDNCTGAAHFVVQNIKVDVEGAR